MKTWEEINRESITGHETRIAGYKTILEQIGRNRDLWPPQDESTQWYRQHIRDMKNMEESHLQIIREEQRWTRQGLNPPYCYPKALRWLDEKKGPTWGDLLEVRLEAK